MRDTSNDLNMTREDLKQWMKEHAYTIESLADMLGMTKQGVQYWVEGKRKIPEPIGRLLDFMGRNMDRIERF